MGFHSIQILMAKQQMGLGFISSASGVAFAPALQPYFSNLHSSVEILPYKTNAHVTRVLFDGTQASGVEWLHEMVKIHKSFAGAEVILCAGAIQSPQILQLSGIGSAKLLQRYGIEVIADSPEVGENLQDHYQMRQIVQMTNVSGL